MIVWECIEWFIDKDCDFLEIGVFVGYEMYKEYGGCLVGGVVVGIGYVSGW